MELTVQEADALVGITPVVGWVTSLVTGTSLVGTLIAAGEGF